VVAGVAEPLPLAHARSSCSEDLKLNIRLFSSSSDFFPLYFMHHRTESRGRTTSGNGYHATAEQPKRRSIEMLIAGTGGYIPSEFSWRLLGREAGRRV
jgi:hypothetical protein